MGNNALLELHYILDQTPITITLNNPQNSSAVKSIDFDLNVTFDEEPIEIKYWTSWTNENMSELPTILYENATVSITVYCSDGLNWNKRTYIFTLIHHFGNLATVEPKNGWPSLATYEPQGHSNES